MWHAVLVGLLVGVNAYSSDHETTTNSSFCETVAAMGGFVPGEGTYENARQLKNTLYNTKPVAIFQVGNSDEIRAALKLAKDYNLQPTVSSSGHDYIGRCTAKNSIHIDMSKMTRITVNKNDEKSDTGASVDVETGANWAMVYKELDKHGYVIIGGSAHTVALGGYIQGGGHSPMTRTYGLGVDNTIGFTMMTIEGDLVYVDATGVTALESSNTKNYEDNGELFWGMRGGGGGTFGIVISYKLKLHQPPQAYTHLLMIYTLHSASIGYIGDQVAEHFNKWYHDNMDDRKIGGYLITNNHPLEVPGVSDKLTGIIFLSLLYTGPYEEAYPKFKTLHDFKPEWLPTKKLTNISTFWEYEKDINDPTGFNQYVINKFIQPEELLDKELAKTLTTKMVENKDILTTCTSVLVGGKSQDFPDDSSALNPNFRSAAYSTSCGTGWPKDSSKETNDYIINTFKNNFVKELYKFGTGVYYNEPGRDIKEWKTDYWGSIATYNRLLALKKKWDPENRMWCHHCVGSDEVPDPSKKTIDDDLICSGAEQARCFSLMSSIVLGFLLKFVL